MTSTFAAAVMALLGKQNPNFAECLPDDYPECSLRQLKFSQSLDAKAMSCETRHGSGRYTRRLPAHDDVKVGGRWGCNNGVDQKFRTVP